MVLIRRVVVLAMIMAVLVGPTGLSNRLGIVSASTPNSGTLTLPSGSGTQTISWSGGPYTAVTPDKAVCVDPKVNCDTYTFTVGDASTPPNYWTTHDGSVTVEIHWADVSNDFDLYLYDSSGKLVDQSASANTTSEKITKSQLPPGTYTVQVVAYLVNNATYSGSASVTSTAIPPGMVFPESKQTIMNLLTTDYPLNVVFVGYHPTSSEVSELRSWIPDNYQPTVAKKSSSGDEIQNSQTAGLLNWNKNHLTKSDPYFVGIRYNYKLRIIQASDAYAQALFDVAKQNTAQSQAYHSSTRGANLAKYDTSFGNYRVLAKGGDTSFKVTDPTKHDVVDAMAVEDWIFNSRYDPQWACAFKNLETNQCYSPSVIQPDKKAYHDSYYDKFGLNIDKMPQGVNKGSSVFFLDTFTPDYAKNYFRPNAYHHWGTDKVINGTIVPSPVENGGSWRITDPDTHDWAGVDFGRTWGGRYRFHFFDLGAAPNDYESASWLKTEKTMSSDYPFGDPPIWQYKADPQWQQTGDTCLADPQVANYTGTTPCRLMPRLGRDVAYDLFFRSTAGYLYRPTPHGDVNWLAVSNWTDFYSHPQWVSGQPTSAPWYGNWWTNTDKLYDSNNVLRWLSAAEPYTRWVGHKGETIPLYDPKTNQPTGKTLDTSPKYENLPAPKYHVYQGSTGMAIANEPLYPGDANHKIATYGSSQVDLTEISNTIEKAKAKGLVGTYDDSVGDTYVRDYIDAHRAGIADRVPGVNTIPSINMVFEKAYTWALPAIVGGIATSTADNEAWGVMNNVNDRFKWSKAHQPACQQTDAPGTPCSYPTAQGTPTQDTGTGFSYTIEHEAAHNLGLSHPHDGSYGVDKCPAGSANAGKWACYWSGLGHVMDISAAPTTYAMDYHPYEVEDQDNIQRGHVAEYLRLAQDALHQRLVDEAKAGATTPSTAYTSDFNRMSTWRAQAADLFQCGDYLHSEYAARNANLAAQGVAQTAANTTDPKLLEAGQVFYFNIHSQCTKPLPDLTITKLTANQDLPHTTVLTATVANIGDAPASTVSVGFADGTTPIGESSPVTTLGPGETTTMSVAWDTRDLDGVHVVTATVDPHNTIVESDKTNNSATLSVTIPSDEVDNGDFEKSSNGNSPDGWSGSGNTHYDTSGAHSTHGKSAVGESGNNGATATANPTWTSGSIAVSPGATYNLSMMVQTIGVSSAPSLQVSYLDATGQLLSTVSGISTTLVGTAAAQQVLGTITVPAGVSSVRLVLAGFSPTDVSTKGTVWFDDVSMWQSHNIS